MGNISCNAARLNDDRLIAELSAIAVNFAAELEGATLNGSFGDGAAANIDAKPVDEFKQLAAVEELVRDGLEQVFELSR